MKIEYLEEYIELARRLNFTKAAEAIGTTQSALSKHLAVLEREFGAELLSRTNRTVELTEAGRILLEYSLSLMKGYTHTREKIRMLSAAKSSLVIGGNLDSIVLQVIAKSYEKARQQGMAVTLTYSQTPSNIPLELIQKGSVDLLFSHFNDQELSEIKDQDLQVIDVVHEQFAAIVREDSLSGAQDSISLADLQNRPFIHLSGNWFFSGWDIIVKACRQAGFEPIHRTAFAASTLDLSTIDLKDSVLIISQGLLNDLEFLKRFPYRALSVSDEFAHFPTKLILSKQPQNKKAAEFARLIQEA